MHDARPVHDFATGIAAFERAGRNCPTTRFPFRPQATPFCPVSTIPLFPHDFDTASVRGGPRGAQLARSQSGQWWWLTSDRKPRVICGVPGVDATVGLEPADSQVKRWGFNLLMPPTAPAFLRKGAAHVEDLALGHVGPALVREEGVLLPDVFDSSWVESVEQRINGVQPVAGLVGWTSDSEGRWGGWAEEAAPLTRPGLLQVCLGLDPAFRAYHSAWDFVLARHSGELAAVASDWGIRLSGRGAARQMTRDEQIMDTPGYRQDLVDFMREFAQRYFSSVRGAARQINPDCLLLSPLLSASTPPPVREMAARQCDLVLVDAPDLIETEAPQLWCVSDWMEPRAEVDPQSGEGCFERRLRQGRERIVGGLRHPRLVGYVWGRFRHGDLAVDDPFGAGLVDENGRGNDALVQPLSSINAVADQLRSSASI